MRKKLKLIRRLKVIGQYEKDENITVLIIERPKGYKDKKIQIQISEEIICLETKEEIKE